VRVVLNVIWLLLSGIWLAIGYLIAAIVMFILIVTIPFGAQALKLAGYALWPFGRVLVPSPSRHVAISVIGNVIWFVLAGWWLALAHLVSGILLCLTIIGIPLGVANFKMAGAALVPFGKEVRSLAEVGRIPPGAVAVGDAEKESAT
jgi:uncharacterized membrane protein YccF (DUF307 family)